MFPGRDAHKLTHRGREEKRGIKSAPDPPEALAWTHRLLCRKLAVALELIEIPQAGDHSPLEGGKPQVRNLAQGIIRRGNHLSAMLGEGDPKHKLAMPVL